VNREGLGTRDEQAGPSVRCSDGNGEIFLRLNAFARLGLKIKDHEKQKRSNQA
jgi:hypothetical protein